MKDPLLAMRVARAVKPDTRVRVLHAGAALEPRYAAAARRTEAAYFALPLARRTDASARPCADASSRSCCCIRRGWKAARRSIIEAVRSGTPVIASDADGNLGLLGTDYPGLFPVGDAGAATRLVERAATDAKFLKPLAARCRERARLFDPEARARRGPTTGARAPP